MKNKEVQESLRQVGIRLIEEPPLLSPESMSSPEAAVRVLGEWLSEMDRFVFYWGLQPKWELERMYRTD